MSMFKPAKIKETASIHAGKWMDKVTFAAAVGITGIVVYAAVKTLNKSKEQLDLTLNEMDWDGR